MNRLTPTVQVSSHVQHPSDAVRRLQGSIGNRATTRLLRATGHVANPTLMRYTSTILEQPLKKKSWVKNTKAVKKSGEGVSGGAFFFQSKSGTPKDVVVKAEEGSEADTAEANRQLAAAGVSVPKARNVLASEPEAEDIVNAAFRRGGYDLWRTGRDNTADTTFFRVMSLASGSSLASIIKKAGSGSPDTLATNISEMIGLIMDESILQQLTNLIVTDILLGNTDRINDATHNLGNLMVKTGPKRAALPRALGPRVTAIDSEGLITEGDFKKAPGMVKSSLKALTQDPSAIVGSFMNGIEAYLHFVNEDAAVLFKNHEQYGALQAALTRSLQLAAFKQASLSQMGKETKGPADDEMKRRRGMLWKGFG